MHLVLRDTFQAAVDGSEKLTRFSLRANALLSRKICNMQMKLQTELNSHKFPFALRAVSDALDKCSISKPQAGAGKCWGEKNVNVALLFSEWVLKHAEESALVVNLTIQEVMTIFIIISENFHEEVRHLSQISAWRSYKWAVSCRLELQCQLHPSVAPSAWPRHTKTC